jgi:hypothetical protein
VSPLSVARAHRWVDVPTLSGFTVWLTGSTRRRPECVFFLHGASTTDAWSDPTSRGPERTSTRAHDGDGLGIYPLKTVEHVNGGSVSTPAPALYSDWSSLIEVQNSSRFVATADPVYSSGVSPSNPRFQFYSLSIQNFPSF